MSSQKSSKSALTKALAARLSVSLLPGDAPFAAGGLDRAAEFMVAAAS